MKYLIQDKNSRFCKHCGIRKQFEEFYTDRNAPFDKKAVCVSCSKQRKKKPKLYYAIENLVEIRNNLYGKKHCSQCEEYKSFDEFSPDKTGKYDLNSRCKDCVTENFKKRYYEKRGTTEEKRKKKKTIKRICQLLRKKKVCTGCSELKHFDEYYSKEDGKFGLTPKCSDCIKKRGKEWYENNPEKVKAYNKKDYWENRERYLKQSKEWRENNKDKIRQYREENRERINKNARERWHNDIQYRIKNLHRKRIFRALNGIAKSDETLNLLGCESWDKFFSHIEDQFEEGMTWDNHGIDTWHIDHIIPCDFWDMESDIQQHMAFHYTNLQPLWAEENMSKNNSIPNLFEGIKLDKEFLNKVVSL